MLFLEICRLTLELKSSGHLEKTSCAAASSAQEHWSKRWRKRVVRGGTLTFSGSTYPVESLQDCDENMAHILNSKDKKTKTAEESREITITSE